VLEFILAVLVLIGSIVAAFGALAGLTVLIGWLGYSFTSIAVYLSGLVEVISLRTIKILIYGVNDARVVIDGKHSTARDSQSANSEQFKAGDAKNPHNSKSNQGGTHPRNQQSFWDYVYRKLDEFEKKLNEQSQHLKSHSKSGNHAEYSQNNGFNFEKAINSLNARLDTFSRKIESMLADLETMSESVDEVSRRMDDVEADQSKLF